MASPVSLTLPMPPSVNELFRNKRGRGRVKTRVYEDWQGHAGWYLRSQSPLPVHGHVVIALSVERSSSVADIDNRVKALFDLLCTHKVIDDDRYVVGFCIAWAPPAAKMARVMILPAANYTFQFHLAPDGAHGGFFLHSPTDGASGEPYPAPQPHHEVA